MHLSFAAKTGDALQKRLAIGSYRTAQGFIGIKNSSEAERKDCEGTETLADHASMVHDGLLGKSLTCRMITHDDREFSTRTGKNRSAIYASEVLNCERTSGPGAVLQALLLGNAIRVPRHLSLSWEYSHTVLRVLCIRKC